MLHRLAAPRRDKPAFGLLFQRRHAVGDLAAIKFCGVGEIDVVLAASQAIERRRRHIEPPFLDKRLHVPPEQCEQKGRDMRAVDVGVGHHHDAAVARRINIEPGAKAAADGLSEADHFGIFHQRLNLGAFGVQDLAPKRQDRLEFAVTSLLGGAAGRIPLHDEKFSPHPIACGAVGQLLGQADAGDSFRSRLESALFARDPRRLARFRRQRRPRHQAFRRFRVGLEPGQQPVADGLLHSGPRGGRDQLLFGLRAEGRVMHAHMHGGDHALDKVGWLGLDAALEETLLLCKRRQRPHNRRTQPVGVRAAVFLWDGVGEGVDIFAAVLIDPEQRRLDADIPRSADRQGALDAEHRAKRRQGAGLVAHKIAKPLVREIGL